MQADLDALFQQGKQSIDAAKSLAALETIRVAFLGKKGHLTEKLKRLKTLSEDQKPAFGKKLNDLKSQLLAEIQAKKQALSCETVAKQVDSDQIDVTLPGRFVETGSLHPVTKVTQRIQAFFESIGFAVALGPEVEDEFHNFEALNIPFDHPARDMHDTFYLENGNLLRTHTSTVQIRALKSQIPPIKIIAPGRVYRCDSDLTHTPMFHQVEGFMVDKRVSFADLKGILNAFLEHFFEKKLTTRFRPSFFPFTEPSAEVDIQCVRCEGAGCRICSQSGWLEVLGCGMIHPVVLKNCALDPNNYSGFAFGLGVDRFAMLRYGITDLRLFFENDLSFLKQF